MRKENINNKTSHAELDSASSTHSVSQQQAWKIPNQVWNDALLNRGFTLLEILIAVIIIAVLAVIAVSAYQRAVVKSRFSALMPMGKALRDGNEAYYLEHGSYATDASKLDVTSKNPNAIVEFGSEEQRTFVQLTRDDMHNNLVLYQKQSPNFPGEIHCEAEKDNALANWLCKDGLKGTLIGEVISGYNVYSLDENYNGALGRTYYNLPDHSTIKDGDICISNQYRRCIEITVDNAKCIGRGHQGCGSSQTKYKNGGECYGYASNSCGGNTGYASNSTCYSYYPGACYWTIYDQSKCQGNSNGGCKGVLMDDHSVCYGNVEGACNTYCAPGACSGGWYQHHTSTYADYSSCIGGANNTCTGSIFKTNSTCVANAVGACVGSVYEDDTSYCTGKYCPEGAASSTAGKVWHREEGWNEEQQSVLIDAPTTTE